MSTTKATEYHKKQMTSPYCAKFDPILREVVAENDGVVVAKLNDYDSKEAASTFLNQ